MKIVFINDGIYAYASGSPRAVGGAERDQWLLGAALASFGWSVTVGVRDEIQAGTRRTIKGVEFVGIRRGHILFDWYRFLSSERSDWIFWRCADYRLGPLVEIAKLTGARTIFSASCDLDVRPSQIPFYRPRCWPLYAWGLSRADRIFVQHAGQLSGLAPRWRSKAHILPKVCILRDIVGIGSKPHSDRTKYVAWVGTLIPEKRPDILIDIARSAPDIRFLVCGGPSLSYGERIVHELRRTSNIEYLGQVSPDKAQQIIAEAAVLLCTSDVEGFPNTFVQAWSNGTPVVSLKIDPDKIIERMGLGALSVNADRAITDISALFDSPRRRDEIAGRARKHIVENHSAVTVVKCFENALGTIPQ
jgi:glycosyltransferase involved in cell wall biosynthesis